MQMSENSNKNSFSSQKGFFKRMLGQEPHKTVKQTEIKQRHPAFVVTNEAAVTPGRTPRPQEVIISPAVKQLNKEGYVVYNTPEKQDIYITVQPDTAFFEDEEPQMVRMAGGSFVGGNKHSVAIAVPVRQEQVSEPINYTQPADIFSNAGRRESFGEIDFNEIIIKKNESFEEELEGSPVLFTPSSYEEVVDPVMEESFAMREEAEMAQTSSGAAEMGIPTDVFTGYTAPQEYELEEKVVIAEEVTAEETVAKDEIVIEDVAASEDDVIIIEVEEPSVIEEMTEMVVVTEAPAGLYVDGNRPIDTAEMETDSEEVLSSFMESSMEAETAMTSKAMTIEALPLMVQDPIGTEDAIAETVNDVQEALAEEASDTVTDMPATIDITDETDMLKLSVPGLSMCEELMSGSHDPEMTIPDDGLEAYDLIFRSAPAGAAAL
jgi:hypothetical protein